MESQDAVRIEEMVNYFNYDYPQPLGDAPFSVTTETASCPWNGKHRLAMIGLQGKKVLVVSPFSKSIESNFTNRRDFFKDYHYPAFELRLQTTPITYAGLPDEFYPDQDWLATTERLKNEISQINFDIALLGCGSYAMPLGIHIRDTLKKQAIYVGGVLQLYFGVMGRRYQDVFFTDQINLEKFIFPLEGQELLKHVTINEKTAREAFGAYF